jgi:flavin reductase (DIM6/NTAB) family NADH-FMN oxidoreductase RutF
MHFDMAELTTADRYKLMSSSITPRPIAWVTSESAAGVRNAAPFSFFNMMAADPPLVALGLMPRADGSYKDTAANILETGEFVVNLVREDDAPAMNFTCIDGPADFDEIDAAGLSTAPSIRVKPPRIASAPVSFECRLFQKITPGPNAIILLGQVLTTHIADTLIDPGNLHVDTPAMKLVARMHGSGWYTRCTDLFQMNRPVFDNYKT